MRLEELKFFDPRAEIKIGENRLPHWQQDGAVYFVTFRLGDSVPQHLLRQWTEEKAVWLRLHPPPWTRAVEREYHARFTAAMERWLDAGHGACVLREPKYAEIVAETLRYFEEQRCVQWAWVVMPNHVHGLFTLQAGHALDELLRSWKLFSARRINEQLGSSGALWQKDYFDRIVRDAEHFARCVRYIRSNPEKAALREGEFLRWESELARGIV